MRADLERLKRDSTSARVAAADDRIPAGGRRSRARSQESTDGSGGPPGAIVIIALAAVGVVLLKGRKGPARSGCVQSGQGGEGDDRHGGRGHAELVAGRPDAGLRLGPGRQPGHLGDPSGTSAGCEPHGRQPRRRYARRTGRRTANGSLSFPKGKAADISSCLRSEARLARSCHGGSGDSYPTTPPVVPRQHAAGLRQRPAGGPLDRDPDHRRRPGEKNPLAGHSNNAVIDLSWSPDGRWFAYGRAISPIAATSELWLTRASDGESIQLTDGTTVVWSPTWLPDSTGALLRIGSRRDARPVAARDRRGRPARRPAPPDNGRDRNDPCGA